MKRLLILLAAQVTAVATLQGCTATGEVDRDQIDAQVDSVRSQLEQTKAELEAAKATAATDAKKADLQAVISRIDSIDAKVTQGQAALHAIVNDDGSINGPAAGAMASTVLPPPWNLVAAIGLPLIVGGIQQLRVSNTGSKLRGTMNDALSLVKALDIHNSTSAAKVEKLDPDAVAALTPGAVDLLNVHSATIDTIQPKS